MKHRRNKSVWDYLCKFLLSVVLLVVLIGLALVLPLRWYAPPTTAFMFFHQQQNNDVHYDWLPLNEISPYLAIAVVASEDQKFPTHYGFDFDSIQKALSEDRKRLRGASTITQQLAKNLYLSPDRSYVRKAIEAYFTLLLELCLDKHRIMELYLNVVEFAEGVYGAKAASERIYHKPAASLSIYEAARLAAVLPNPKEMSAAEPSSYVVNRSRQIVRAIKQLGGVDYLNTVLMVPE